MKKYLESIILMRRVGLLTSTLVSLVIAAMGIVDVKATGYPDTLGGDAFSFDAVRPFIALTSWGDTISGNSLVRENEVTGYPDTLRADGFNFGAASPSTVLTSFDDIKSENSFVGGGAPTTYPDTLPGGAINFGNASSFTVLTSSNDSISQSSIGGNVGIQSGTFTLDRKSSVNGNLVYKNGVTRNISGNITGTTSRNDGLIDSALLDAQMLSDAAFAEAVTPRYATLTTVNLTNNNLTITGGANEKVVLRLTDFVLSSASFTLSGTATTAFLINVTRNFSLNNASISLVNVPVANVLFNIRGTGTVTLTNSSIAGNLLALNRTVTINHANVSGKVIANQVNISNSNVASPTQNR